MTSAIRPSGLRVRTSIACAPSAAVRRDRCRTPAGRRRSSRRAASAARPRTARGGGTRPRARPRNQCARRHREGGVLGEHGEDRVDVAALPCVHVGRDEPRRRSSPSARRVACWLCSGSRSSTPCGRAAGRWRPRPPRCRARRRSRPARSRARRAGSAPRAGARAGAGARRRTRARRSRAARSGPRAARPSGIPAAVGQRLEPDRLRQRLAGRAMRLGRRAVVDGRTRFGRRSISRRQLFVAIR